MGILLSQIGLAVVFGDIVGNASKINCRTEITNGQQGNYRGTDVGVMSSRMPASNTRVSCFSFRGPDTAETIIRQMEGVSVSMTLDIIFHLVVILPAYPILYR